MQQPAVAAVNGGMIRHRCTKTAQQHVAGLRLCQCDTVKTSRLHIVKIEILTVTPPVIPAMKIRHLNSRQMVSIPEQRVTVRHPVLKAPPGEMRHTAELVNRPRQTSHHGKSLCTCSRRSASLSGADHRGDCGPVPQSHPASLPAASPPATSGNTPPAHRRYSRRGNIFPLRRSHHEAARLRWRTSPGVRQNR